MPESIETPMCPSCEMGVVDDPYTTEGGVVWHGECYADFNGQCGGCGADVTECECELGRAFTTVYLPGDGPKASTNA